MDDEMFGSGGLVAIMKDNCTTFSLETGLNSSKASLFVVRNMDEENPVRITGALRRQARLHYGPMVSYKRIVYASDFARWLHADEQAAPQRPYEQGYRQKGRRHTDPQ